MAALPNTIAKYKSYILKGVLAIYILAFASLYVQVQSLFGDNGVVPIRDFASKNSLNSYNIILLAPKIGLDYGKFVELLCLLGIVVAFLSILVRQAANALVFGLLWYTYYSICSVGQGFMSFHADLLLLEVGFISILLAPLLPSTRMSQADHDHLTFFLFRWVVFRYFVTNIFNNYLDDDKAWYTMTAIPMAAHGTQFPSTLSWYVFNSSPQLVKLFQAYEHSAGLCTPFLFLFDLKFSRLIAFWTMLFFKLGSAFFFNFGWQDLLICVCLLSFLKDAYDYKDKRAKQSTLRSILDGIVLLAYLAIVVFIIVKFYGLKLDNGAPKLQVLFTPSQFKLLVDHLVPISLVLGLLGLLSAFYTTYSKRKTSIVKTLAYTVVVVALFFSTVPTLTRFAPGLDAKIKPISMTKDLSRFVAPYMLSNNYLLLSKVSQHYADGRPELLILARESAESPTWTQFSFRYKANRVSDRPSRVLPHLPRLELKLWYAARSSLQNNQWIQTLAYRLATQEKDVLSALAPSNSNFKANQIKVVLHNFKYSKDLSAGFWSESKFVSDYMQTTTVENLKFSVKSSGINLAPPKDQKTLNRLLNNYLDIFSDYVRGVDHTSVLWAITAITTMTFFR